MYQAWQLYMLLALTTQQTDPAPNMVRKYHVHDVWIQKKHAIRPYVGLGWGMGTAVQWSSKYSDI